ncbi:MAG: RNA polymerase sigma factor, partial [Candidatus Nanopelagicales bacterium]
MNEKFLYHLYEHHNEWVKIVRNFGEQFYAEDIVQEMYLKLAKHENNERFYRNGTIYKGFVWIVLRNMFYDYEKAKNKLEKVSLTEAIQIKDDGEPYEKTNAQTIIDIKISETINNWHWYDQMLFKLYRDTGYSTRQIEKETGISFKSVWATLKECKESLKKEVG